MTDVNSSESGIPVVETPLEEVRRVLREKGYTMTLPRVTDEQRRAMEHNEKLNIELYGDAMGYLNEPLYSDNSSEDD